MRFFFQVLLACLILSALQAAVAFLAVCLVLLLVWGLLFRTRETAGLIAVLLFFKAVEVHPWVTLGVMVALAGVVLIARDKATGPEPSSDAPLLLPHLKPPPQGRTERDARDST